MRELKFRAMWSGELHYFTLADIANWGPSWDGPPFEDFKDWEQFTGLRDKNGREIYEGDIVKLLREMKYSGRRGDIGAIEADTVELGYLVMNVYSRSRLTEPRSKYMEVIGNIHENPELLD